MRQNPKIGAFYVQGLKFVAVGSYKEIEKRTEEGEVLKRDHIYNLYRSQ